MAIDAKIENIWYGDSGIKLDLVSYIERGIESIAGQESLLIVGDIGDNDPLPKVGDKIWGGGGFAVLCRDGREIANFRRITHTEIEYMKPGENP